MRKSASFKEGDKVFAKIKGYPAWPAVVLSKNGKKFNVEFYGTKETGTIKPEDMFYYLKNKEQMAKGSKKKEFKDAVEEIEKAIAAAGGLDGDNDDASPPAKRRRSNSEVSSESQPSKKRNSGSDSESTLNEGTLDTPTRFKPDPDASTNEASASVAPALTYKETPDEDLPFLPNVNLVSELNLKNWIIYADLVKESPNLYKSRPVDQRNYYEQQVLPVLLPSGAYAGLKLHKTWPLHFANEYEAALYDSQAASEVLLLKEAVIAGETTPETSPEAFLSGFEVTETEIRRDAEMKLINNKYKRVERLRSESTLVELDAKIKNCLAMNKADTKKALEFLDSMLGINMDEIMLKKHSHVVEMIRRLRKYIGNIEEWSLSASELEEFKTDAQKIRHKADGIYRKFKAAVKLPESCANFWDGFNEVVRKFRDDCLHLSNREIFVLCAEPFARRAVIERLEQEEELLEADIHQPEVEPVSKEEEKEEP